MFKQVVASVVVTEMHEQFTQVPVIITSYTDDRRVEGIASLRGTHIAVKQVNALSDVYYVTDDDYSYLEDLEKNGNITPWDKEYWQEYIEEITNIYILNNIPQEHWRLPKRSMYLGVYELDAFLKANGF